MSKRRVVISGLGCVTSLGDNVEQVFEDLLNGKSGIQTITKFDTSAYTTHFGGEIVDWAPKNVEARAIKKLDKFALYALDASINAVSDAGLDFSNEDPWRCGAIIGSGIGGIEEFEAGHAKMMNKGPMRVSPMIVPKLMCNAAAGNVSIHFGLCGPNYATATACASAGHAIGAAMDAIRYGTADVIVTGGSEAALTPLGLACFVSPRALSKRNDDPQAASRPFDKDRDGFVLSEGCGILVLEEYEHAKARGAKIYAEVLGWGQSADGSHITAPREDGAGAGHAMAMALQDAGLNPEQIDYINAHGTSTSLGDKAETRAIKRTFGDAANDLAVSSTKSMTGHTLGASGGIEAVATAKSMADSKIAPTINLDNPDEECDLDYVPNTARDAEISYAMSNSFGFGGHNVSLVFGKV